MHFQGIWLSKEDWEKLTALAEESMHTRPDVIRILMRRATIIDLLPKTVSLPASVTKPTASDG